MQKVFVCLLLLFGLAACSVPAPITGEALSGRTVVQYDLAYGEHQRQKLDVYRPTENGANRPVFVFFHGGFWQFGDKSELQNVLLTDAMAARGAVVISADYRLYPDAAFPAFMEDGAAVIAWARQHAAEFGGDPDRIYVAGHSAGAYIALMLGLDERYLAARGLRTDVLAGVIGIAGPYGDWVQEHVTVRGVFATDREGLARPSRFVRPDAPPVLLLAGGLDYFVGSSDARDLVERLRAVGGQAEARVYPLRGHLDIMMDMLPFATTVPVAEDVARFMKQPMLARAGRRAPVQLSLGPAAAPVLR